jgi:light-regulated signal transduction histidine kinase (bacteriophytochrome)
VPIPNRLPMRSDRLLRGMHKVCSHDLPNQIVVLQSLLQMLQLEEADRLSPDGQEYVRRLQNVTQRTTQMARFLKEMNKLAAYVGTPEELSLDVLTREIQAALKQQHPRLQFTFDWQWSVPAMLGDYRTMLQALIEILAWSAGRQAASCTVRGSSAENENQTSLHFTLATGSAGADNPQADPEQRMEIILARELLAVSQATLEVSSHDADGNQFTILVPNR